MAGRTNVRYYVVRREDERLKVLTRRGFMHLQRMRNEGMEPFVWRRLSTAESKSLKHRAAFVVTDAELGLY